jgi:hypothetical protein
MHTVRALTAPDPKRSRFLYGILFAWVPCLPFFVGIARDVIAAAGSNKATGLGAIAGGLSEAFLTLVPLSAVAAIVLLARSFARGHWLRSIVAVISMLWSALVLFLLVAFTWVLITHR